MGISLVTGPSFDPVSLEEAKDQCRVTTTNDDGLLTGYILAARTLIETTTRRVLVEQTFDFTADFGWPLQRVAAQTYPYPPFNGWDHCWRTRIELPLSPVIAPASVLSVKYVDSDGLTQTLDPSQYVAITDGPVGYIDPAYGVTWPIPRWQPQAVTIRFKAGYGSSPGATPEPLRMAILLLVAHFYNNREASSGDMIELPFGVEALISPFRQSRILS